MNALKPNQYRCAVCRVVFNKTWSDAEAKAEHDAVFLGCSVEHADVVCDDCYKKVMGEPPASLPN